MFTELADIWIKLLGVWFLADSIYSLIVWSGKGQSFWKDHSIRIIRLVGSIAMILWG